MRRGDKRHYDSFVYYFAIVRSLQAWNVGVGQSCQSLQQISEWCWFPSLSFSWLIVKSIINAVQIDSDHVDRFVACPSRLVYQPSAISQSIKKKRRVYRQNWGGLDNPHGSMAAWWHGSMAAWLALSQPKRDQKNNGCVSACLTSSDVIGATRL